MSPSTVRLSLFPPETFYNRSQKPGMERYTLPYTRENSPDDTLTQPTKGDAWIFRHVPDHIRNHFVAMCGEFAGTFLFLFFALAGTQVANNTVTSSGLTIKEVGSNPQQLQYIALCFGFSLAVNAWIFFRISGGLFNPAVTFGMWMIGALPVVRAILLFVTQILGGMAAAAIVGCLFPGPLDVNTVLSGGTSVVQGLFIEVFLTTQLVFTIFMLAAEKHKATFIAPVGIGLSMFVAELIGVYFTGGSLNPARSFGPAVYNLSFPSYHWIYWVGPFFGSVVAAGFYKLIKFLEYETANPGQDEEDHDAFKEKQRNAAEKRSSVDGRTLSRIQSRRSLGGDSVIVDRNPLRPFATREARGSVGSESTYVQRPQNGAMCATCTNCGKSSYPWGATARKDMRFPVVPNSPTVTQGHAQPTGIGQALTLHEGAFEPFSNVPLSPVLSPRSQQAPHVRNVNELA
ncbi:hypothetical protein MBLNU459_g5015t1 [Dothideomycetes sp. NU459]